MRGKNVFLFIQLTFALSSLASNPVQRGGADLYFANDNNLSKLSKAYQELFSCAAGEDFVEEKKPVLKIDYSRVYPEQGLNQGETGLCYAFSGSLLIYAAEKISGNENPMCPSPLSMGVQCFQKNDQRILENSKEGSPANKYLGAYQSSYSRTPKTTAQALQLSLESTHQPGGKTPFCTGNTRDALKNVLSKGEYSSWETNSVDEFNQLEIALGEQLKGTESSEAYNKFLQLVKSSREKGLSSQEFFIERRMLELNNPRTKHVQITAQIRKLLDDYLSKTPKQKLSQPYQLVEREYFDQLLADGSLNPNYDPSLKNVFIENAMNGDTCDLFSGTAESKLMQKRLKEIITLACRGKPLELSYYSGQTSLSLDGKNWLAQNNKGQAHSGVIEKIEIDEYGVPNFVVQETYSNSGSSLSKSSRKQYRRFPFSQTCRILGYTSLLGSSESLNVNGFHQGDKASTYKH